ncbi:gem-associated protein 7-like [Arctopsyche grandis]|uniref:gem-associated protein 7-like n=1 Tax=Arctopsyche grandis TaxID=121162 RepID=UPI00406DA1AE
MDSKVEPVDSEEEQKIRAILRESFLTRLTLLYGKKCDLKLHENTNVRGIFKGTDIEFQEILISDLETPTCKLPHSIIRGHDTVAIDFS